MRRLEPWSRDLLPVGAAVLLLGCFLTPPWVNAGAIIGIAGMLARRIPLHRSPGFWWGCGLGGWILLDGVMHTWLGTPGARLRPPGPAWLWLGTAVIGYGLAESRVRRWAFTGLAGAVGLSLLLAVVQFSLGWSDRFSRGSGEPRFSIAQGFSEHHLTYGLVCALAATAVISVTPESLGVSRSLAWLVRGASLAGLVLAGARGAVLAGIAGISSAIAVRGRRMFLAAAACGILGVAAAGAWYFVTNPARIQAMLAADDGRWPIWRTSVALIEAHPILGCGGKEGFQRAYVDAFPRVEPGKISEFPEGAPHAHNSFLAMAAEFGVPALILHLGFWIAVLVHLGRQRHACPEAWRLGVGVAMVALVGGCFEAYATRVMQGAAIHAFLGLALALSLERASMTGREIPVESDR